MAGSGDAAPESSREKRKREARLAFEDRAAREALEARVRSALSRSHSVRSREDERLLREHASVASAMEARDARRRDRKTEKEARAEEREDPGERTARNVQALARMIRDAGSFVLHTGAGFSTAACIPDFRGSCGVWTMRAKGMAVPMPRFERCAPTKAHMCAAALYNAGYLSHVVTQNVDGLHGRAGMPRGACSELHGTVFKEKCTNEACLVTTLARDFDVTAGKPHNGRHRHKTGRLCPGCGGDLRDVVVQFGERIDDDVLAKATEVSRASPLSLVMGTSLKIPPAKSLPRLSKTLVIVNLQWTAEDKHSKLKLNARCDDVLEALCGALGVTVCSYDPGADAIGARVLAAGETFVKDVSGHRRRCDVKAEEATTFNAGEGEGDDARSVRFGVGGECESKKHEKFAPLSKRARRMKNPSVPIPTNPATDRA
jgi:NAD-dependent SIR2 family protein deacetylase